MYYVYILISKSQQNKTFTGQTNNIERRILEHNNPNNNRYSSKFLPWDIRTYIAFTNKQPAEDFERYLKIGSGFSFMKKRLL